jgi:opacity protein-like surface antigen
MNGKTIVLIAALIGVWPALAAAQGGPGLIGYATYGSTSFAASESFEAVGASGHQQGFGGGVSVTGVWRGLFVDVGVARQKMSGERVFVDNGTVYPLGIPLEITIRPIDLAAGWRFSRGRLSPYAGAGITFVTYRENSDFELGEDDVDESATGGLFLAGADVRTLSWLSVGGEVRYRKVSGVLGGGGVSQIFGDDQLGGVAVSLRVTIGL